MSTMQELVKEAQEYQAVLAETARLEAELQLARAQNPLSMLLEDAGALLSALNDATTNVEIAIDNEHITRRAAKEATGVYDDAEAEWTYDQMAAPVPEGVKAPTVDVRKAQIAAALVKARQGNGLAKSYAAMTHAKYKAEDAKMALDQAEKRFSATRSAADLVGAMLNAAK